MQEVIFVKIVTFIIPLNKDCIYSIILPRAVPKRNSNIALKGKCEGSKGCVKARMGRHFYMRVPPGVLSNCWSLSRGLHSVKRLRVYIAVPSISDACHHC